LSTIEYLPTKDGKKAPQELAISKDLAQPCIKCGRTTLFLKAAFCDVCKLLWFLGPIERLAPAKEMLNKPELVSFSPLELERITWIIEYGDNPDLIRYWDDWIKDKSQELYQKYIQLKYAKNKK
jgi:hypothetical protein